MAAKSHFLSPASRSYHSWKAARDSLSLAIRSYASACNNLCSDYESGLLQLPSDPRFSNQRLAEFEAELLGLHHEEKKFQNIRTDLTRFRNKIPTLVKIHRLSPEILSQIFLESHHDWISTRDKEVFPTLPTTLSSVCHPWRSIALALPALWSCIDVAVDGSNSDEYFECAQLWVARSSTLSVHIWHSSESDDDLEMSDSSISQLISFLTPIASRIRHLKVSSYLVSYIPQYVTACMVNFGTPGLLTTLDLGVDQCDTDPMELLPLTTLSQLERPSTRKIDEFLQSVTHLTLASVIIPWESAAYSGLVELVISFFPFDQSDTTQGLEDLAQVLRSSPQLRVVSLTDHMFLDDGLWTAQTPPIHLQDLRSLTLSSASADECSSLLPLFSPGPNPLYLKMLLETSFKFQGELELFFSRSNVTTLWANAGKQSWFTTLRHSLSRLESLTLQECDFSESDLFGFLEDHRTGYAQFPWPRLTSLRLLDCLIDVYALERLLAIHPVRQVRIDYTSSYDRLEQDEEELMMRHLRQCIPDITISDRKRVY